MKHSKLDKQLVNLRVILQHLSESSQGEGAHDLTLTVRLKTLSIIANNKNCSPSLLMEHLNIAKSNLAIICKGLLKEGLIVSERTKEDKRNIYYDATPLGEKELTNYYTALEKNLTSKLNARDIKIIERKIDELVNLLNKSTAKKK